MNKERIQRTETTEDETVGWHHRLNGHDDQTRGIPMQVGKLVKSMEPEFNCKYYTNTYWVGKIPWRRAWQSTPVFLPGECPWTEEPGGLQSMRSQRVRHDWATQHILPMVGFPDGSVGKESSCSAGDTGDVGSIPGSGRNPGGGNGYPLQYSCLDILVPWTEGPWHPEELDRTVYVHTHIVPVVISRFEPL